MHPPILIDTSAWIHFFRNTHDPAVRARISTMLRNGTAAWCAVIRIELWNGVRGDSDHRTMQGLQDLVQDLPIDSSVWQQAIDLTQLARGRGYTVPTSDLIISACAKRHGVAIETCDRHFALLDQIR